MCMYIVLVGRRINYTSLVMFNQAVIVMAHPSRQRYHVDFTPTVSSHHLQNVDDIIVEHSHAS